ncbi:MAG TPA: hypothetical protein VNX88_01515 [Terriglobales bacterium]|nr:hypothetical protein [Terriglobales bacterium]
MISIHLSDEELTAAAAGERSPRTAGHLEICPQCWEQMSIYRERLASLKQDVCYSGGRSAIDWGRQSRNIQQRILEAQIRKTAGRNVSFALATSALAVILAVFLLLNFRGTTATRDVSTVISDAALISDIEAHLNQDLPEALQPASLLVGEMGGLEIESTNHNVSHERTRTQQP